MTASGLEDLAARLVPVAAAALIALPLLGNPANRSKCALGRAGWALLIAASLLPGPAHEGLAQFRLPLGLTGLWWIAEALAARRRGYSWLLEHTEEVLGIAAASLTLGLAAHLANGYAPNWSWVGTPAFPFAKYFWLAWTWTVLWPGFLALWFACGGEYRYSGISGRAPQFAALAAAAACLALAVGGYPFAAMIVLAGGAIVFFAAKQPQSGSPPMSWRTVTGLAAAGLLSGLVFELLNAGSAARRVLVWPDPGGYSLAGLALPAYAGYILQAWLAVFAWEPVARWAGLGPAGVDPPIRLDPDS